LVLRQLGKEDSEGCAQHAAEVLKIYTHYVMSLKKPELLINYVTHLPRKEQAEALALYFETITDPELKAHCLSVASSLNLDVDRAVQKVIVSIREKPFSNTGEYHLFEEQRKIFSLDNNNTVLLISYVSYK
jgi:hypothetical protein